MNDDTKTGRQLINTLIRWQVSGGVWRVSNRNPAMITVALLRCDAGEVVDQISSGDPEWVMYLQDRGSSDPD